MDVNGTAYIGASTTNAVRIEPGYIRMQDASDSGRTLELQATKVNVGASNSRAYSGSNTALLNSWSSSDGQEVIRFMTNQNGYVSMTQSNLYYFTMDFVQNNKNQLRLSTNSRIGISELSPDTILHITNNTGLTLEESTGTGRKLLITPPQASSYATIATTGTTNGLLLKSASGGNQLFLSDSGEVGIGTSTPAYKLDVNVSSTLSGIAVQSSVVSGNRHNALILNQTTDNQNGRIGILMKGGNVAGVAAISSSRQSANFADILFETRYNGVNDVDLLNIDSLAKEVVFNDDSTDISFRVEGDSSSYAFFINGSTSDIGIGTSTPNPSTITAWEKGFRTETGSNYGGYVAEKPNLWALTGFSIENSTHIQLMARDEGGAANYVRVESGGGRNFAIQTELNKGKWMQFTASTFNFRSADTPYLTRLAIDNYGRVGLGSETPTSVLYVNASPYGSGYPTALFNMVDTTNSNFVVKQGTNSYINITTANSAEKITFGNQANDQDIIFDTSGNINSTGGDICITGGNCLSLLGGGIDGSGSAGNISYFTDSDTLASSPIYQSSGSIGIGTASPTEKLEISGNLKISGDILPSITPTTSERTINTLDSTGNVGYYSSIAIGTDGYPVISYQDSSNQDLKVVKCGNIDCSSGNTITTVETASNRGLYTSIAIGSDTYPVISYSYWDPGYDLMVVKCGNTACSSGNTITTVDGTGTTGSHSSLGITSDTYPIISYYYSTSSDLMVVKCGNTACSSGNTITTVDSTGDVGSYTALAIGDDDLAIIAYRDGTTNLDLKVLKCGNSACSSGNTITTVDSTGDVGGLGKSIAIGNDSLPIISYYDATNQDLKVVKCGNSACSSGNTITTVDSTGSVGYYSSIVVGNDGNPIIVYTDETNKNLMLLTCGNANCTANNVKTIIEDDTVSFFIPDIIIGSDSQAVMSYGGGSAADLKVAKCGGKYCEEISSSGGSTLGSQDYFFNRIYAGTLSSKNSIIAGFDLAEEYYSNDNLVTGEIVSITTPDKNRNNQVKRADKKDKNIPIGIVSTDPGLLLANWRDEDRENMYPIALSGRVPVKVSMENGPIKPGDRITLSSEAGVGAKAITSSNTIGIALEEATVSKKITVFINLEYWESPEDKNREINLLKEKNKELQTRLEVLEEIILR